MNSFFAILTSIVFAFSFSMRSANIQDAQKLPFDYELNIQANKNKVFNIDIERERENNLYFTNMELSIQKNWNYFQVKGLLFDIESRSINIKEIDFLGKYNNYYTGIVLLWENNIPTQKLKFGIEYTKEINLFLSQPKLSISAFTLTKNFKRFDKEFKSKLEFNLFTFGTLFDFNFYMQSSLLQYKNLDWQYKTGIEVKF